MIIGDQSFTYLKQALDENRGCGKYVFWRNPDRFKGYISDYWRATNAAKEKETPAET